VGVLTGDFADTFGAALDRALEGIEGYELTECQASGVQAMMGKTQCKGEDLNGRLGKIMDEDELLKSSLDEILGIPWPEYSIEGSQQEVITLTGAENFIYLEDLSQAFLTAKIEALDARIADRLDEIEAIKESGDEADLERALEQGEAVRTIYEQEMSALGAVVFDLITEKAPRLEKKGLPGDLGICPNPKSLGGCQGEDVSTEAIQVLQGSKKFMKAIGG